MCTESSTMFVINVSLGLSLDKFSVSLKLVETGLSAEGFNSLQVCVIFCCASGPVVCSSPRVFACMFCLRQLEWTQGVHPSALWGSATNLD